MASESRVALLETRNTTACFHLPPFPCCFANSSSAFLYFLFLRAAEELGYGRRRANLLIGTHSLSRSGAIHQFGGGRKSEK
jgi:hypothetical protein